MNKLAAVLILFVWPVAAQQPKPDNNPAPRVRLYEPKYLKHARADAVGRFVHSIYPGIQITWEPVPNLLVLRVTSAVMEDLDKAEALIRRYDVPEPVSQPDRQIDMTIHLVRAYGDGSKVQGTVPPDLAPVVKEMKGALPYAGFSLVDTIQVIVRDGLRLEDGLPRATGIGPPQFYNLTFREPSISPDGKTVSLREFHFGVKIPVSTATSLIYQDEGITTPLTIHEGQKQVLGKVKTSFNSNDDLFVVLSYKAK